MEVPPRRLAWVLQVASRGYAVGAGRREPRRPTAPVGATRDQGRPVFAGLFVQPETRPIAASRPLNAQSTGYQSKKNPRICGAFNRGARIEPGTSPTRITRGPGPSKHVFLQILYFPSSVWSSQNLGF